MWSPTGPLNRDYDDVRRYKDASIKGVNRALKAGKRTPILLVDNNNNNEYEASLLVTLLGALEAVYVPIEVREAFPTKNKVNRLGIASLQIENDEKAGKLIRDAVGLEYGRVITRDIGGL